MVFAGSMVEPSCLAVEFSHGRTFPRRIAFRVRPELAPGIVHQCLTGAHRGRRNDPAADVSVALKAKLGRAAHQFRRVALGKIGVGFLSGNPQQLLPCQREFISRGVEAG